MAIDPILLLAELTPYAGALDMAPARPIFDIGWVAYKWPAPTVPLIPGAPPYDGVYRGSWVSRGLCVRLKLDAMTPWIAARLRTRHASQLGADGALYQYGIAGSSQRANRDEALLEIALRVDSVGC